MKKFVRQFLIYARACGVDVHTALQRVKLLGRYRREHRTFRDALLAANDKTPIANDYPVLHDYHDAAGTARGHYFHQDLWAARKIYHANPNRHIDIGSRVDGFVAHLLVFRPVEIIDVRPMTPTVDGLSFIQADATAMAQFADGSVESLSSLHAAEHFGLGRYNDPIDIHGHLKFMASLARVLQPGGRLYFSTPIGRERVQFNAHRVTAPQTVLNAFTNLQLVSFAAVNDAGDFVADAKPDDFARSEYACGLFEFTKGAM